MVVVYNDNISLFYINLTHGSRYQVERIYATDEDGYDISYVVKDDAGNSNTYPKNWFLEIEDWRDSQINKILD